MKTQSVDISFTKDEARVLFEALAKLTQNGSIAEEVDECEFAQMCALESRLEKSLTEVFEPSYKDLVSSAKQRLTEL